MHMHKRTPTIDFVQGATLRAGFPKEAKSHPVYGVLDDSQLQALLRRGKAWAGKARQCMQTMQGGRPMATSLIFGLLDEAKSIKLSLSPEVRPLCSFQCPCASCWRHAPVDTHAAEVELQDLSQHHPFQRAGRDIFPIELNALLSRWTLCEMQWQN